MQKEQNGGGEENKVTLYYCLQNISCMHEQQFRNSTKILYEAHPLLAYPLRMILPVPHVSMKTKIISLKFQFRYCPSASHR